MEIELPKIAGISEEKIKNIQADIEEMYDLDSGDITRKRRFAPIVEARRFFAVYLHIYQNMRKLRVSEILGVNHTYLTYCVRRDYDYNQIDNSYRAKRKKIMGFLKEKYGNKLEN